MFYLFVQQKKWKITAADLMVSGCAVSCHVGGKMWLFSIYQSKTSGNPEGLPEVVIILQARSKLHFFEGNTGEGQREIAQTTQFQTAVIVAACGEADCEGVFTNHNIVFLTGQEACAAHVVLDSACCGAGEEEGWWVISQA